ncbi:Sel1 repeat protein [Labrenzia sp. THAF82]|nr:Sel1 repeat protein [Labrenzia sp. THAF82]
MRMARIKNKTVRRKNKFCPADNSVNGMQKKSSLIQRLGKTGTVLGALMIAGMAGEALAFDGQPAAPRTIGPQDLSPSEALRAGARQYYSGDKAAALSSLQYAAENGQPMAAWKLGEMYSKGDGVKEDDLKAFEYYSQIVREHGDDRPDAPDAPFVSSAFVALGSYYLTGIDGAVPQSESRARQIFTHAASYFGDAAAQYELGRMYQKNNSRMAVRWYNLAALKGHVGAQARLGETLYEIGNSEKKKARGLMWMTVARAQASGVDASWINAMHEQYFAVSPETVRQQARSLADGWIEQNRPDILASQQVPSQ